ncbi:MAG: hypothetical protein Q8N55_04180 [bacterium]|nr:hypothetical protein [bacterium]
MAKGERKRGYTSRVIIKPNFLPLVPDPHKLTRRQLLRVAKEERLILTAQAEKERLTFEQIAARSLTHQRMVICKKNAGNFYLHLCAALYGGRILRENASLFNGEQGWECSFKGFKPDIVVDSDLRTTFGEVKSVSGNTLKVGFAHKQFLGYSQALLENKGSEMFAGIFKYGSWTPSKLYVCRNEDGHFCDNRCLVKNLSQMTRSLLVIPHNLLAFLLMLSNSEERDHTTSTARNYEHYKIVLGSYFTTLHNNWESPEQAVGKILEHSKFDLGDFKREDFYLGDLQATQRTAPIVYCRNKKIGNIVYKRKRGMGIVGKKWEPFIITEYKTPHTDKWKKHFEAEQEKFISSLGMTEDYKRVCEWRELTEEREGIRKEPEMVIGASKDNIPF